MENRKEESYADVLVVHMADRVACSFSCSFVLVANSLGTISEPKECWRIPANYPLWPCCCVAREFQFLWL